MNDERIKPRVLVVDDDAAVRQAIQRVLEGAGYKVIPAADGQQAVDQFSPEQFDLVLLDLDLPGRGGWDVFERLTTKGPVLPVIIITGMPGQYATALAAGAGALLEKPLDVSALLRTIAELLAEPAEERLLRISGYRSTTRHFAPVGGPRLSPSSQSATVREPRPLPRGSVGQARHRFNR